MIRLDRDIFEGDFQKTWPPPFTVGRYTRVLTCPFRLALLCAQSVKQIFFPCINSHQPREQRENQGDPENAREEGLDELRDTLKRVFSDERCISDIIERVRSWTSGQYVKQSICSAAGGSDTFSVAGATKGSNGCSINFFGDILTSLMLYSTRVWLR